jgi:glycosyltransferase involved in cell wall biosynthesis
MGATGAGQPLVSIVTPSFNKGSFIEETILSIRNQDYSHIEHIVMDGGSKDGTLDILRKYEDRLTWISEPDKGQSDAINKGWRLAKGEIIAYLNADDTYTPGAVEAAVRFLADHPDVDLVYGKCSIISDQGRVIGECGEPYTLAGLVAGPNPIPQPAAFFRRRVLDEVGYLDTGLHMAMDHDLWVRIGSRFSIAYTPHTLASFRLCAGTKTMDSAYGFGPDTIRVLDKLYAQPDLPAEVTRVRREAYAYAHMLLFMQHRAEGRRARAARDLCRALRLDRRAPGKFGGFPMLRGFFLELLVGRRGLARLTACKASLFKQPSAGRHTPAGS